MALGSGWTLYLSPFHLLTEELNRVWLGQMPWLLLAVVFSGIVIFPRFWCVYLCPTGLLFSIVSRWRLLRAKPPQDCIHCGRCEKSAPPARRSPLLRRPQPTVCFAVVAVKNARSTCSILSTTGQGNPAHCRRRCWIHPPRSSALRNCTAGSWRRCSTPDETNCGKPVAAARCFGRSRIFATLQSLRSLHESLPQQVYPTHAIQQRSCNVSHSVYHCPRGRWRTDAVLPAGMSNRGDRSPPCRKTLMGLAEIDHSRCPGWSQGKLCLLCQEQCPRHAIESPDKIRPRDRRSLRRLRCL